MNSTHFDHEEFYSLPVHEDISMEINSFRDLDGISAEDIDILSCQEITRYRSVGVMDHSQSEILFQHDVSSVQPMGDLFDQFQSNCLAMPVLSKFAPELKLPQTSCVNDVQIHIKSESSEMFRLNDKPAYVLPTHFSVERVSLPNIFAKIQAYVTSEPDIEFCCDRVICKVR